MNKVEVFIAEQNVSVTLDLTEKQIEMASNDENYLRQLVNKYTSQRSPTSQLPSCDEDDNSKSVYVWSPPCVELLLSLYEEYQEDFNSGTKRHNKIWDSIARKMKSSNASYTMSGGQCQSKLNGLKKTYKKLIQQKSTQPNEIITWPFFNRVHKIFGSTGLVQQKVKVEDVQHTSLSEEELEEKNEWAELLEKYINKMKTTKRSKLEREERRNRRKINREVIFNKIIEMEERHHKERMEILKLLCESN